MRLYVFRPYVMVESLYLDASSLFSATIDGLSESEELGVRRWWCTLKVAYIPNTELDILPLGSRFMCFHINFSIQ